MTTPRLRWILTTAAVLFVTRTAQAQAPTHVETQLGWTKSPVTNAALDDRIRAAATQYRSYAPVPRIAFYDIAYPKDSAEAATMGWNAVLVVTAVVQDSTELPFGRIYCQNTSGQQPLALFAAKGSRVADGAISGTFGQFRIDAIYLLPLATRLTEGELLADFAQHRQGFRLAHFTTEKPPQIQRLGQIGPPGTPAEADAWVMLTREYPDLAPALHGVH